jgi:uncharacterized membrane protein YkvA (DUF1232 family)
MRVMREVAIVGLAGFALLYLMSPSLLPDFLPLIGWIDEGIATTLIISALNHWGIDVTGIFGQEKADKMQGGEESLSKEDMIQALNQPPQHPQQITQENMVQLNERVRIPRRYIEDAIERYERDQARSQEYPY